MKLAIVSLSQLLLICRKL